MYNYEFSWHNNWFNQSEWLVQYIILNSLTVPLNMIKESPTIATVRIIFFKYLANFLQDYLIMIEVFWLNWNLPCLYLDVVVKKSQSKRNLDLNLWISVNTIIETVWMDIKESCIFNSAFKEPPFWDFWRITFKKIL